MASVAKILMVMAAMNALPSAAATTGKCAGSIECEAGHDQTSLMQTKQVINHGVERPLTPGLEDEGCFELSANRQLCYGAAYAGNPMLIESSKDAAVTLLALHGMGMGGYKAWPWEHMSSGDFADLTELVRFVAIDRPGYSESSAPFFGYSYAAFASDLKAFIDGSPKLFPPGRPILVLGTSSGGPNMLSLSYYLKDYVGAGASVSGDGPYMHTNLKADTNDNVRKSAYEDLGLYLHNSMIPPFCNAEAAAGTPWGAPMKNCGKDRMHGTDLLSFAQTFLKEFFAALGINKDWHGAEGWVNDFTLERIPWSFDVQDVQTPINIYTGGCKSCTEENKWQQGDGDFCPICTSAQFLSKLLPNVKKMIAYDDKNHFYSFQDPAKLKEIVQDLLDSMRLPSSLTATSGLSHEALE